MSERPEEPNKPSDAESLLPVDEHVEEGHDAEGRKVRHRGIYLLPNLFTTANLFAGCLLYTSPSPRDKRQSRMPSSA